MQAIKVENLSKSFKNIKAVDDISFYVEKNKLFAFLGPNGAGKSTTIDMLCTLKKQDGGSAWVNGFELGKQDEQIRSSIGIVFQDSLLDALLTVEENLYTRATFYALSHSEIKKAVDHALDVVDAQSFKNQRYGTLSGGQRRRADIARALVHKPEILFLDEPTTGLDPKTKGDVWSTIKAMQKEFGMTVFLTTHYMEEAATADYIVLIDHGKIAAQGTPYDLKENYSNDTLRIKPKENSNILPLLDESGFPYLLENGLYIINIPSSNASIPLITTIQEQIESFEVVHGSMEDVFLNLIGREGELI